MIVLVNVLLYIWQLPQNLLGLLVIFFSKAKPNEDGFFTGVYFTKCNFGVSLGSYIILNKDIIMNDILHERGHQEQSLYLGWLYLIIIGLPSACGNLYDRWFHKNWTYLERYRWYYSLPWEHWADKLGDVKR